MDRKSDQIGNRASLYAVLVLTREIVNPVAKALWYIESHFGREITLDDVAAGLRCPTSLASPRN